MPRISGGLNLSDHQSEKECRDAGSREEEGEEEKWSVTRGSAVVESSCSSSRRVRFWTVKR